MRQLSAASIFLAFTLFYYMSFQCLHTLSVAVIMSKVLNCDLTFITMLWEIADIVSLDVAAEIAVLDCFLKPFCDYFQLVMYVVKGLMKIRG